jgi:hypothetical protein
MKKTKIENMSIKQLQEMIKSKGARLHELISKRQTMESELSKMAQEIRLLSGNERGARKLKRARPKKIQPKVKTASGDTFSGPSFKANKPKKMSNGRIKNSKPIHVYMKEILEKAMGPISIDQIVEKLNEAGFKTSSSDKKKMVSAAVYNHKDLFSSPKKGLYILKK